MIVIQKFRCHARGLPQAGMGLLLLCMIVWSIMTLWDHGYQKFSPVSSWYQYDTESPVVAASTAIHRDHFMNYHSNSIYHREIAMRWEDTMVCDVAGDSGLWRHKVATQVWEERMRAISTPENEWWEWNIASYPTAATRCRMTGIIIGTTDLGYKKVSRYKTPWFKITGAG